MFDLNRAVSNWRQELGQNDALDTCDLSEMESHLRDEIEDLAGGRLSPQEAFIIAAHRLGDTGQIAAEFAKVHGSRIGRRRFFWMLTGVLAFIFARTLSAAAAKACAVMAVFVGLRGYTVGVMESGVDVVVLLVLAGVTYCLFGRGLFGIRAASLFKKPFFAALWVAGLALLVFLLRSACLLVPGFQIRLLSAQEYGRIMVAHNFGSLCWAVLGPIALGVLLIVINPVRRGRPTRRSLS